MADAIMAGSKTSHFKYTTNSDGVQITTKSSGAVRTFAFNDLSPEMQRTLGIYGLKQKLSDDAASTPDTDGKITVQSETFAKLVNGVWAERSAGDSSGLSKAHIEFAEAAAKAFNKDVEEIKANLLAREPDHEDPKTGNTIAGDRTLYVRAKSKLPRIAAVLADMAAKKAAEKAKSAKLAAKIAGAKGEEEEEGL
jgi:hypothetical protein